MLSDSSLAQSFKNVGLEQLFDAAVIAAVVFSVHSVIGQIQRLLNNRLRPSTDWSLVSSVYQYDFDPTGLLCSARPAALQRA